MADAFFFPIAFCLCLILRVVRAFLKIRLVPFLIIMYPRKVSIDYSGAVDMDADSGECVSTRIIVRDASVHQAFSAFQKGSIRMVFSSDVIQSDLEKDVLFREDGARFVKSRYMSKFRVNFVILSFAEILLC